MTDTYARALVQVKVRSTDAPTELVEHTVYHHHTDPADLDPWDWDGYTAAVANAFSIGTLSGGPGTPFSVYNQRQITVKGYDLNDPKPRPERSVHTLPVGTWETSPLAPRELAMCMRYFGPRNLVSQRGRLYIGPWLASQAQELVSSTLAGQLLNLGYTLSKIAGGNTSWVLASTKPPLIDATGFSFHDIVEVWVNDQWSHMESREAKELSRWTTPITPGLP